MFITGLGTAHPPHRYTKADCWKAFASSEWPHRLDRRSRKIVELVLNDQNGIEARWLAPANLDEVFTIDPDTLHRRFVEHAPALATQAARCALDDAGIEAGDIGAVVVSTCTGYLCPGLSGYVIERLGLRTDVQAFDLVGQGCAAALPNMRMGEALLADGSCRHVLSICVEVASAAMYLDDDPGVLISACLFGDGAGAAVLSHEARAGKRSIRWVRAASRIDPAQRDALRFEQRGGMLRNILTLAVPRLAAEQAGQIFDRVCAEAGIPKSAIDVWIWHAGGRDVLRALMEVLELEPARLRYSAAVLRDFGNLSSAFVYFVLEAALNDAAPTGWWWLGSFGAGFSCHGALLEVG